MKKFFFFAAALSISAAAMATPEIFTVNQTDYPTESDVKAETAVRTSVDAGTVLYSGTAFDVANAFATSYQRVGLNANAYTTLKMNGTDVIVPDQWGIQGNDNPKDAEKGDPAVTGKAPTQGAVFEVTAKADGMIYVFHKASSNKKYTVFENYNGTSTLYGYDFAMITCPGNAEANKGKVEWLAGTLCKDIITDSLITYIPATNEYGYVAAGTIVFPEIAFLRNDVPTYGNIADSTKVMANGAYAQNGLGVIAFPVMAGISYYVNAVGSKMSLAAIAFTTEAATITVSNGEQEKTLYEGKAPTAVENVESVKAVKVIENGMIIIEKNGVRYNALGQKL